MRMRKAVQGSMSASALMKEFDARALSVQAKDTPLPEAQKVDTR